MKPNKITIHCTDTKNGEEVLLSDIRKWHRARGFIDIGYHFVIQPDGSREIGRDINCIGAHVHGANDGNVGIALCGKTKFTKEQFYRLKETIDYLMQFHKVDRACIFCHYQFSSAISQGKTCPNFRIGDYLDFHFNGNESKLDYAWLSP
jgi:hypothetical protein